ACGHVRLPLLLADGKLGESLARLTCTLFRSTDRARHAREVSRSESAERRVDENICARQLGPLLERAAAGENRKSLVGHFERRLELLTRIQGEAHIGDDENIHSHGARGVHWQVVYEAALDEHAIVPWHGREHTRCGHARAHRGNQISGIHEHELTGFKIGGDRSEGNGQLIEVLDLRHAERRATQQLLELLPLNQASRQHEALIGYAERIPHQEIAIVLLAAKSELFAWGSVLERILP